MRTTFKKSGNMTICYLYDHNNKYTGIARCHPEDEKYYSYKVGQEYAYTRALLKKMRADRDGIINELKSLKHLYSILNKNDNVSKKSIECYTIRRQMKLKERDIQEMRDLIRATSQDLLKNIKARDIMHNRKSNKEA